MCGKATHRVAGAWAGVGFAWGTGLPWWAAAGSAAVATLVAAGRLSPDADQYKGWRRADRWTPDEILGRGGPLQHRGLSHWWGLPAFAAYLVHVWSAAAPSPWWVLAWAALIGWASHLLLDFCVGARGYGRNAGIPLAPWWWHVGLGFKNGGFVEGLLMVAMCGAGAVIAWQAATA